MELEVLLKAGLQPFSSRRWQRVARGCGGYARSGRPSRRRCARLESGEISRPRITKRSTAATRQRTRSHERRSLSREGRRRLPRPLIMELADGSGGRTLGVIRRRVMTIAHHRPLSRSAPHNARTPPHNARTPPHNARSRPHDALCSAARRRGRMPTVSAALAAVGA